MKLLVIKFILKLYVRVTFFSITTALLQITVIGYHKLRQLCQIITGAFYVITKYGNTLLQITAGIANHDVITNYVVTFLIVYVFFYC